MSTVKLETGIQNTSGRTLLRNSGVIINTQMLKYSTEIASTGASYYTYFTLNCTKLLPAGQSNLHATWKIPGAGNYSYVCGGFISIGGVTSFENRYFYTPYSEPDGHMWGTDVFEGIGSGTAIPVSIGFNVHHGEGGNYPYTYINPIQGRNDARRRGPASSNILIFEVAI